MADGFWRPADTTEAARNETAFVEWLRATARLPNASPAAWRDWAARDEDAFLEAVLAFAGLEDDPARPDREAWRRGVAEALLVRDRRADDG